jgi:Predicted Zn-dependent proteases and their inactivated homologs
MKENISAKQALKYAKAAGAKEARVTIYTTVSNKFTVTDDKLERLERATGNSLSIQLFVNDRYGNFTTNSLDNIELEKFIKNCTEITKAISIDKCRKLPNKDKYFNGVQKDLGQYDPYILELDPASKKKMAFECYNEFAKRDKRIVYAESDYEDSLFYQYIADSQGFEGDMLQSYFSLYAECALKEKNGSRPSSWHTESSMIFKNLTQQGIGTTALKKTIEKLSPKKISPIKTTAVIDTQCASRFISPIFNALNGRNIQQNNSFLKDKESKKIFSKNLTIVDRPHSYGMSGSRYFDDDGIATYDHNIIKEGVIETYYIDTYDSFKLKREVTIDSPSVPIILPYGAEISGTNSIFGAQNIINKAVNGVYITGINGGNCNSSTGDFSFGIEGFLFKKGKIIHPINEMNITGNIISLWRNLLMVGNDSRKFLKWQIPSLAFKEVDII